MFYSPCYSESSTRLSGHKIKASLPLASLLQKTYPNLPVETSTTVSETSRPTTAATSRASETRSTTVKIGSLAAETSGTALETGSRVIKKENTVVEIKSTAVEESSTASAGVIVYAGATASAGHEKRQIRFPADTPTQPTLTVAYPKQ